MIDARFDRVSYDLMDSTGVAHGDYNQSVAHISLLDTKRMYAVYTSGQQRYHTVCKHLGFVLPNVRNR